MSALVKCADCKFYIAPAPQFEANSVSACLVMERWLDQFPKRRPKPEAYNKAYAALGNQVWMPDIERRCEKFVGNEFYG